MLPRKLQFPRRDNATTGQGHVHLRRRFVRTCLRSFGLYFHPASATAAPFACGHICNASLNPEHTRISDVTVTGDLADHMRVLTAARWVVAAHASANKSLQQQVCSSASWHTRAHLQPRRGVLRVPAVLAVLRRERVRLLRRLPRPHVRHALQQDILPEDRLVLRRAASLDSSAWS